MKSKLKYFFVGAVIIIASLLASRDLFKKGYFSIHDDLQVGRLYQMDLCFRDGQFPCRWVPDMGYGYGYPLFNYYPPLPYYFGELVHALGFSFLDSTKAMFMASIFISGILMFLFGKKLWGGWGGLLSAVLYLWSPYHSVDIYVRGAMNEAWSLAFLPGIYWAIYEIIENDKNRKNRKKFIFYLALFFGLLLLSHNLMAFIFAPTFAVFSLLLIWVKKKNLKESLFKLILGGIWGFGLAAFFTLPVLLETKFVHVETMLMGYFNYLAHFVPIGKMLFTRFWGYGSSGWLQETGMPFQVGLPQWPLAVLVTFIAVILFFKKKISKNQIIIFSFFFFLFLFTLFMTHPRSVFIWKLFPILDFLQFPWRFLTLVIFSISVLGGGIIYFFKNKKTQFILSFILVIVTIVLNYTFFRVEKTIPMTDNQKLFSAKGWNKLQTDAIFDYLPIYAKAPPGGPAPEKPEIKSGTAAITEIRKGTDWSLFSVEVSKEAKIQIPLYDFPDWKVWVDKKITAQTHDNFLGLINVVIPPGIHEVNLKLTNTLPRVLGNLISLISWIILVFSAVLLLKKKEK